jgi:hypothetical protein
MIAASAMALLLLLLAILLPLLARTGAGQSPKANTFSIAVELWICSITYKEEFGDYPQGDNAEIVRHLMGENPKRLQILSVGRRGTNSLGQCLDGWRMPFEIRLSGTNTPIIRSAGPNKVFGDDDDFIYTGPANSPSKL